MTHDTLDTSACNTKKRGRCWGPCTWNNYTEEDLTELNIWLKNECIESYINIEVSESGTPHLQFCFKFQNARTFDSLKKRYPKAHFETSNNWNATKNYCCKVETAISNITNTSTRRPLKDPLDGLELRPWQQLVMDIIAEEPDDRTIHWIYDNKGCAGKTTLAKHICLKRPNEVLYISGKSADIKYGITQFLQNEKNDMYVCFIDLTRSIENFVSYEGIESIKNGIFYNTKYESGMVIFNNPHVIVLANFEPDYSKLSLDRWNVITL